jgi:hypothetical protein
MAHVSGPDGVTWTVATTRLRWRPRRRRIGDLDAIGIVLAVLSIPLLALEWAVAGVIAALRPATTVTASAEGPPSRTLRWHLPSARAAREKVADVARRIEAGEDVSADADERHVGA